jgi:hypothetical protein
MNHRNMNPSFRTFRQSLIVFAEPSIAAQPPKGALHHPPPRQHFKAVATQGALDHLEEPAAQGIGPTNQLPAIHAISPDQLEHGEVPLELGPLRVLEISPMNHYRQQQSQGVHYDMALAAGDLLARIVASGPPFSVVLTVWLSMMAALGVGALPSASRTLGRKASWMRSQVPSARHRRKYPQAVPQGGRSWGIIRQGQPLRSTYKMAFTTSRKSTVRGRPPHLAAGSRGANSSHWASVRSLGYGFLFIPPG